MNPALKTTLRLALGGTILRANATGMNLTFPFKNIFRDFWHTLMATDTYTGLLPVDIAELIIDMTKVSMDAFNKTGSYLEFEKDGGMMDLLTQQGKIERYDRKGKRGLTRSEKAAEVLQELVTYFGTTSEIWVRLAVRSKRIRQRTEDFVEKNGRAPNEQELQKIHELASNDARQLIDFSQGGRLWKSVDNVIPYLNASTQGFRVMTEHIGKNPFKFAFKATQFMAMAGALAAMGIRKHREEWEAVSPYTRSHNFLIPLPIKNKEGDFVWLKIPKAHETTVFSVLAESLAYQMETGHPLGYWDNAIYSTQGLKDKKEMSIKEYREKYFIKPNDLQLAIKTSIPLGGNPLGLYKGIPIIDAITLYETNHDAFTEAQYYYYPPNMRMGDILAAAERIETGPNKTENIFKDISNIGMEFGFDISPERLKGSVEEITTSYDRNIWSQLFNTTYDAILHPLDESEKNKTNDMLYENFVNHFGEAFVKSFTVAIPEGGPRNEFWIKTEQSRKLENTIRAVNFQTRDILEKELSDIVNQVFDAEKQGGEDGENEAINQYSSSQEAAIYINNLMERYEVLMSGQLDEYGIEYEPLEEEYLREKLKDLTNRFIKEFVREKKGVSKPFVYIYTISSRNPMTAAQMLYAQWYEAFKQEYIYDEQTGKKIGTKSIEERKKAQEDYVYQVQQSGLLKKIKGDNAFGREFRKVFKENKIRFEEEMIDYNKIDIE